MNIRSFQGKTPVVDPTAYVDPSAVVIGDVSIGAHSSVWPMTVVRGDVHRIVIGERSNIQDGTIMHVTHESDFVPGGFPLLIGDGVTVGHQVVLHACEIHDHCLIGMGAIVLDGAVVEEYVVVGAGAVVPPGKVLKRGHLYLGNPARLVRQLTQEEINYFGYAAAHYVDLKNKNQSEEWYQNR
jgi:carbonic anhydrase/acetyltransferase-like protein (isoleucine patch superfamily)